MTSHKKTHKSGKKELPNIEFSCKFRGKYDLSKSKQKRELDINSAINLFKVIKDKNARLIDDATIKMYSNQKMFSFSNKKTIGKEHHRVPYMQVTKFFIMKDDVKIVILGIHHKSHKWFLVFQFSNGKDATDFCDEIEQGKQGVLSQNVQVKPDTDDVNVVTADSYIDYDGKESVTKISIDSEMLDSKQQHHHEFDNDEFFNPDMQMVEPKYNYYEKKAPSLSRSSSQIMVYTDDDRVHCDDLAQSKLKELYMDKNKRIYSNADDWKEDLLCMEYPIDGDISSNGPVYLYSARQKADYSKNMLDLYGTCSSDDSDDSEFVQYKPKFSPKNESYQNYEPKMIYLNN